MKWFRFADDEWTSREYTFAMSGILSYDKFQHFMGGIVFTLFFGLVFWDIVIGTILSIVFWFLWEIKDALIRWEDNYITSFIIEYNWGGDGYSYKDMVMAWIGAILTWLILRII